MRTVLHAPCASQPCLRASLRTRSPRPTSQNLPMDAGVWGNSSWATSNIMPNSTKDAPAEIHKRLVLDRRLLGIKYMQESHCNQSDRW